MRSGRWISLPPLTAVVLGVFAVLAVPASADAGDWSHWRGPEQNGVSREKDLPESWSPNPEAEDSNLIWKAPFGARATPIIQNDRLYVISKVGEHMEEQERVICLDAKTGKLLAEYRMNVFHSDIVSVRLGWASMAGDPETGNVYAHGTQGFLLCFDKDLRLLWKRSLTEEYGRVSGYGGRLASPIVDGDLVILGMLNASWGELARGGPRFVAFDKRTGEVVWWGDTGGRPVDTYYSNPVVAVINGERLLISGAGDGGVHAFKVRTGEKVWSHPVGPGMLNCSPVVQGNLVYIGQGEENPGTDTQGNMLCLDASKVKDGQPELVWRVDGIKAKYASPILHEGKLYIPDEVAKLYCLDAKDGRELWTHRFGRNSKGSPVWADGKIYIPDVNSRFLILQPEEDGCKTLHNFFFKKKAGGADVEINGGPAIVDGKIYFSTSEETYCLGKKNHSAKADAIPAVPQEEPADKDAKPAHAQVVPADVTLQPGEKATFKIRLFDAKGRFLREGKGKWSVGPMLPPPPLPGVTPPAGPTPPPLKAEIDDDGHLTIDTKTPSQFGNVLVDVEGLKGRARVRVAPLVPYKQDFENVPINRTPGGWVNTQGKFTTRKVGDSNVLVKLGDNPSPLVARANAFITIPNATNYTIECDLLGNKKGEELPDMGIVANRYSLVLAGQRQELRLLSWEALPRIDKSIGVTWKPDVWYRLKLTVEMNGDKAMVRGKWWERDQPEPKEWTVEVEDPKPNDTGSPALYGFAPSPGAEIFYDNLSITPQTKN